VAGIIRMKGTRIEVYLDWPNKILEEYRKKLGIERYCDNGI